MSDNTITPEETTDWKVGDYTFVKGRGICRINKLPTATDKHYYAARIPEEGALARNNVYKAELSSLFKPFTREEFDEAIQQANTPQDKRFENIDDLLEHILKLINSDNIVDVGRAYSYGWGQNPTGLSGNAKVCQNGAMMARDALISQSGFLRYHLDNPAKKRVYDRAAEKNIANKIGLNMPKGPITPMGPSVGSEKVLPPGNHQDFEVGDLVFLPSRGIAKITKLAEESSEDGAGSKTEVKTLTQQIENLAPARGQKRTRLYFPVPSNFPFYPPSEQDAFEEAVREAYTPQEPLKDLDAVKERVKELIESTDLRDLGKAWSYVCGHSDDALIKEYAGRLSDIFVNQKLYIDFKSEQNQNRLGIPMNFNALRQVRYALARQVFPALDVQITPMIGQKIEPIAMPDRIDWSLKPLSEYTGGNKKQTPRKKAAKPKRAKKGGKKKNNQAPMTPEEKAQRGAAKAAEQEAARVAEEQAAAQAVEEEAAKPAEPEVKMSRQDREITALNDYFNEVAGQIEHDEAQLNELMYFGALLSTEEANFMSFRQKYIVLHEVFDNQNSEEEIIKRLQALEGKHDTKRINKGNYASIAGRAFENLAVVAEEAEALSVDEHAANDDTAYDRMFDRLESAYGRIHNRIG